MMTVKFLSTAYILFTIFQVKKITSSQRKTKTTVIKTDDGSHSSRLMPEVSSYNFNPGEVLKRKDRDSCLNSSKLFNRTAKKNCLLKKTRSGLTKLLQNNSCKRP